MLGDVGELFDEWMPRLVKIQVDGHVEGDSENHHWNNKEQKSVSGNLNEQIKSENGLP